FKSSDLLRRWWQSDQVKINPARQFAFGCGWVWSQTLGFKFSEHERVDRIGHPAFLFHGWKSRATDWLEGPVGAVSFRDRETSWFGARIFRFVVSGPRRSHLDPCSEIGDLAVGKFLVLGRHLQVFVGVANGLDEQTFLRIAGNDRQPRLAS